MSKQSDHDNHANQLDANNAPAGSQGVRTSVPVAGEEEAPESDQGQEGQGSSPPNVRQARPGVRYGWMAKGARARTISSGAPKCSATSQE